MSLDRSCVLLFNFNISGDAAILDFDDVFICSRDWVPGCSRASREMESLCPALYRLPAPSLAAHRAAIFCHRLGLVGRQKFSAMYASGRSAEISLDGSYG
jgi:hypothetical protein